jgi:hypothetical protein
MVLNYAILACMSISLHVVQQVRTLQDPLLQMQSGGIEGTEGHDPERRSRTQCEGREPEHREINSVARNQGHVEGHGVRLGQVVFSTSCVLTGYMKGQVTIK